jgi:hypothetical protein
LENVTYRNINLAVEKYGVQKIGITNFQVVQQNYSSPRTHNPKVEERSKQYGKIYFLLMKYYNNEKLGLDHTCTR